MVNIRSLLFLSMILLFLPLNLFASALESVKFISIADIHFDPYSTCKASQNPCGVVAKLKAVPYQEWHSIFENNGDKATGALFHNTNYGLFQSLLAELKVIAKNEQPGFILILGDFLAHNFDTNYVKYSGDTSQKGYESFVKKTLQFLTQEIAHQFPACDIFPVIGNNDSYTGDYSIVPHGIFFQEAMATWSPYIKDPNNRAHFQRDFPNAGYYSVNLPGSKHYKLLVLNSVLFSDHIHQARLAKAADAQLAWLQKELTIAASNHEQILIAEHIPMGVDAYATALTKFQHIKHFWQPIYEKKFTEALNSSVLGILSGHIHAETFQVLIDKKIAGIPVFFTPSISPIYGNNPGFKIFTYTVQSLNIKNSDTFYYPLSESIFNHGWKKQSND